LKDEIGGFYADTDDNCNWNF